MTKNPDQICRQKVFVSVFPKFCCFFCSKWTLWISSVLKHHNPEPSIIAIMEPFFSLFNMRLKQHRLCVWESCFCVSFPLLSPYSWMWLFKRSDSGICVFWCVLHQPWFYIEQNVSVRFIVYEVVWTISKAMLCRQWTVTWELIALQFCSLLCWCVLGVPPCSLLSSLCLCCRWIGRCQCFVYFSTYQWNKKPNFLSENEKLSSSSVCLSVHTLNFSNTLCVAVPRHA